MIVISQSNFTRPNNANGYIKNDLIGIDTSDQNMIVFPKMDTGRRQGGYIIGAQLTTDGNNPAETGGKFRLYLYNRRILTVGDGFPNSLFEGQFANDKSFIGYIDFELNQDGQGTDPRPMSYVNNINMAYVTTDGKERALYGILVVMSDTYNPERQQSFYLKLITDQF